VHVKKSVHMSHQVGLNFCGTDVCITLDFRSVAPSHTRLPCGAFSFFPVLLMPELILRINIAWPGQALTATQPINP